MAGNVWEWTLTEYEGHSASDLTNDRPRVLRGGSWDFDPVNARASSRYYYDLSVPHLRDWRYGFRVVVAAPVP
ncbi:MAG: SUMF1/EgtB/PvdO family nonheme iron enzyme [Ardenticatenia bacterium]|nr:SUMF1/EgtB/PvdO family nonheme iron enzyme [Ardenticatenia bacterium]